MTNPPTCATCRFWKPLKHPTHDGVCRRYPPKPRPFDFESDRWPPTHKGQWCGEHAPAKPERQEESDDK